MLFVSIPLSTKSIPRSCLVRFHESDKALKIPSEMEVHRALYCLYTVHTAYIASNAQSVYTVFTVQTAYTAYTVACMPLYS